MNEWYVGLTADAASACASGRDFSLAASSLKGQARAGDRSKFFGKELDEAMKLAQGNDRTTVITLMSDAFAWVPGDADWDVGVPEVSERSEVNAARADQDVIRSKQRIGV